MKMKEEKQTPERKRETRGEQQPAFINTANTVSQLDTHHTLHYTPPARLPERKPRPQNKAGGRERQPHPSRCVKYNRSEQPDRARRGHQAPERFRKLCKPLRSAATILSPTTQLTASSKRSRTLVFIDEISYTELQLAQHKQN